MPPEIRQTSQAYFMRLPMALLVPILTRWKEMENRWARCARHSQVWRQRWEEGRPVNLRCPGRRRSYLQDSRQLGRKRAAGGLLAFPAAALPAVGTLFGAEGIGRRGRRS